MAIGSFIGDVGDPILCVNVLHLINQLSKSLESKLLHIFRL